MIHHRKGIKLLEWAHVMYLRKEDLKISEGHPLYRKGNFWFGYHLERQNELPYPAVHFRCLTDLEVNNVNIFFERLFKDLSLAAWLETMDNLLEYAYSSESYVDACDDGHLIILIMENLEKLAESLFLVYHTKSLEYLKVQDAKV